MDFILGDFCLSCDRQTNGTAFCSACRLKQSHHFTRAESTKFTVSCVDTTSTASQHPSSSVSITGFYLPPAYDFLDTPHLILYPLSIPSRPHSTKLSEQAHNDLKDYVGAFDQTRAPRRVSMQNSDDFKPSPSLRQHGLSTTMITMGGIWMAVLVKVHLYLRNADWAGFLRLDSSIYESSKSDGS